MSRLTAVPDARSRPRTCSLTSSEASTTSHGPSLVCPVPPGLGYTFGYTSCGLMLVQADSPANIDRKVAASPPRPAPPSKPTRSFRPPTVEPEQPVLDCPLHGFHRLLRGRPCKHPCPPASDEARSGKYAAVIYGLSYTRPGHRRVGQHGLCRGTRPSTATAPGASRGWMGRRGMPSALQSLGCHRVSYSAYRRPLAQPSRRAKDVEQGYVLHPPQGTEGHQDPGGLRVPVILLPRW
jgi:hypothetical protein